MKAKAFGLGMIMLTMCGVICLAATRGDRINDWVRLFEDSTNETVALFAPVTLDEDFTGIALDATNDWAVAGVNSGTAAIYAATGGTARMTTGAADDDDVDFASELVFKASKSCVLEARLTSNDIAHMAYCVGFSDAKGEAADVIAVMYSTEVLSAAADWAGFYQDSDNGASVLCSAVKATVESSAHDTGTDAVNGTYHVYRVEVSSAGNVDYWLDGAHVASDTAGITTTAPLCAYVGAINREDAANTLDIDYVRVWQGR